MQHQFTFLMPPWWAQKRAHPSSTNSGKNSDLSAFATLCLLLFLTACNSMVPTNSTQPLAARVYHQQIEMSGRLSAQYEQNNKPQAAHINFNWSQTSQQTSVTLSSPTGQTLATLLVNAQGAQLNQADKPPQVASNVNQLLLNALGWPLPVASLRDWLQGFLDPEHKLVMTSAISKNSFFLFDGWRLEYAAWQKESVEGNTERPKRLDLIGGTEQTGVVSLRIVIDEWVPE